MLAGYPASCTKCVVQMEARVLAVLGWRTVIVTPLIYILPLMTGFKWDSDAQEMVIKRTELNLELVIHSKLVCLSISANNLGGV